MTCEECGQKFIGERCPCGWKPAMLALLQQPWMITYCNYPVGPSCNVALRHRPGQLGNPLCKWHRNGTAYVPSAAPEGCPDPEYPWPWKTDREREEQARKLYWQEKFKQRPALYAQWITKPQACIEQEESQ